MDARSHTKKAPKEGFKGKLVFEKRYKLVSHQFLMTALQDCSVLLVLSLVYIIAKASI